MKLKMPTRIALIFSILLVFIAVYFLFLDNSGSINPMVKDFSFGRIDNVTKIHLSDQSQSITLTKTNNGWRAEGEFIVKDQLPELFLQTINSIKIKAPASKETRNELKEQLVNSKHIDIYKGQHKACSYYILYDSANTQETFLMKKWAKLPLEAEIPGLKLPLASLYHCDLAYWKAKNAFPVSTEDIDRVSFESNAQPAASFILERGKGSEINLSSPGLASRQTRVDQIAAHDYFASLSKVQYIKDVEDSDSLELGKSGLVADYTIHVQFLKKNIILKFLPYYKKTTGVSVKNPDMFVGISSLNKTPFIGRYADFDPVIRNFNYFISK